MVKICNQTLIVTWFLVALLLTCFFSQKKENKKHCGYASSSPNTLIYLKLILCVGTIYFIDNEIIRFWSTALSWPR